VEGNSCREGTERRSVRKRVVGPELLTKKKKELEKKIRLET